MKIKCRDFSAEPNGRGGISIEISGEDNSEILSDIGISECVEHFGSRKILDELDKAEVLDYFGIEE